LENIELKKTDNAPAVILNYAKGFIELDGKSYPEDTFEFYVPIIVWLETYFGGKAQPKTVVNIKLTYFNSATTQSLFDILDAIQDGEYHELEVNWFYDADNENGLEDFEDYADEFADLNIKAVAR